MAKLYFNYSAMNAGKSTILLQSSYNYHERGMRTLLMKPAIDTRDGATDEITSRIGLAATADIITPEQNLEAHIHQAHAATPFDCILIDEAQFLTKDQVWQLAASVDKLGVPIMCYGLRTDFWGELFEGSATLLAIADAIREVRTICECGRKATMVVRLGPDGKALTEGDQVSIGKSTYVSLCRRHWEEKMGRQPAE